MRNASAGRANIPVRAILPVTVNNCCKGLVHTRLQPQTAVAVIKDADRLLTKPNRQVIFKLHLYSVGAEFEPFGYFKQLFSYTCRDTPAGRELSPLETFTLAIIYEAHVSCPSPPDIFYCSGALRVSEQLQWGRDVNLFVSTLMVEDLFFLLRPEGRISASAAQSAIQALPLVDAGAVTAHWFESLCSSFRL